jgi:hypothetical protein
MDDPFQPRKPRRNRPSSDAGGYRPEPRPAGRSDRDAGSALGRLPTSEISLRAVMCFRLTVERGRLH